MQPLLCSPGQHACQRQHTRQPPDGESRRDRQGAACGPSCGRRRLCGRPAGRHGHPLRGTGRRSQRGAGAAHIHSPCPAPSRQGTAAGRADLLAGRGDGTPPAVTPLRAGARQDGHPGDPPRDGRRAVRFIRTYPKDTRPVITARNINGTGTRWERRLKAGSTA